MKKIRFISLFSALAILVLSVINILYGYTSWHEKAPIAVETHGVSVQFLKYITHSLIIISITLVFVFLMILAKRHSQMKKKSIIAIGGLLLLILSDLYSYRWLFPFWWNIDYNMDRVLFWTSVSLFWLGEIILCVAVMRISNIFPHKSLAFWGGVFFFTFALLYTLSDFIISSFHVEFEYDRFEKITMFLFVIQTISNIGIALFFLGLTNNQVKNGNK